MRTKTPIGWSLSARRAWIEISLNYKEVLPWVLSLSARRAWIEIPIVVPPKADNAKSLSARRAWIEILVLCLSCVLLLSLSARRAWIEIIGLTYDGLIASSLSARRAWIEIHVVLVVPAGCWLVALRKESVDRNALVSLFCVEFSCRSPQGERG